MKINFRKCSLLIPKTNIKSENFLGHPMHHDIVGRWASYCRLFNRNDGQFRHFFSINFPGRSSEIMALFYGVGSLVNLLFPFFFGSTARLIVVLAQGSDDCLLPTLCFCLPRPFDYLFQPFRLKFFSLSCSETYRSFPEKDQSLIPSVCSIKTSRSYHLA